MQWTERHARVHGKMIQCQGNFYYSWAVCSNTRDLFMNKPKKGLRILPAFVLFFFEFSQTKEYTHKLHFLLFEYQFWDLCCVCMLNISC